MSRADRGLFAALALFLALGVGGGSLAATAESTRDSLRPTGPVKINADRAEWQKGGSMVYTGNVRLESGDLKLSGDKLTLKQYEDGQFEAKVDGKPAMLDHKGLEFTGARDGERPPVSARASQLTYDSREEIVEIAGQALLTRGTDKITGENIRYDVAQRRIEAKAAEGGQVQIELQPPPRKPKPGAEAAAPPAPAAGPTP
ncbi:MAG: lptA [Panacagrimonas sp.]|jgi:lipopolysaccharide transport protein LptA|nr:lipopolysaccharide transport periplasmic protein LptA [Panacagrimonas sp.]MCC2657386.1 lptA [Panacagrimonas sp.]